ncbi:MAG: hypothetical protein ACTS10_14740 [Kiloniellales bacterium]
MTLLKLRRVLDVTDIGSFFIGILVIHAAFLILFLLSFGASPFVNLSETALTIGISAILVAGIRFGSVSARPLVLTTALFILLFVHLRLTALLILPAGAVGFLTGPPFTAVEIREALTYLLIGTAVLFLGMETTATFASRTKTSERVQSAFRILPKENFIGVGGLILFWGIALGGNAIAMPYLAEGHLPALIGWPTRFFNIDAALVVSIAWLLMRGDLRQSRYGWIVLLLIVVWLVVSVMGGSRGGAMRIWMFGMVVIAAYHIRLRYSPMTFAAAALAMAIVSLGSGFAGHMVRLSNVGAGDPLSSAKFILSEQTIYQKYDYHEMNGAKTYSMRFLDQPGTTYYSIAEIFNPILARLATIDYGVQVMTREGNQEVIDSYLRSPYFLKNIANRLVLGTPFPDAEFTTGQVFTAVYRENSINHVKQHYLTEPWTIWGLAILLFGFTGGLFFLFVCGALLQLGYALIQSLPGDIGLTASPVYLFLVVYGALNMFGLDDVAMVTIHFTISMSAGLLFLFLVHKLQHKLLPQSQHEN